MEAWQWLNQQYTYFHLPNDVDQQLDGVPLEDVLLEVCVCESDNLA